MIDLFLTRINKKNDSKRDFYSFMIYDISKIIMES